MDVDEIRAGAHPEVLEGPGCFEAGDVFVHPERGRLTVVSNGVASSGRPTVARIVVAEGEPIEIDVFRETKRFELVSRGRVQGNFTNVWLGRRHLFLPVTGDPGLCALCGDRNTPNHVQHGDLAAAGSDDDSDCDGDDLDVSAWPDLTALFAAADESKDAAAVRRREET